MFMHVVSLLDAPQDEVTNVEGNFLNVVIMVSTELLVVTSLSHDGSKSLFFDAVEVDAACLFGHCFLAELDPWSSEGGVSRLYNF
jgi:hypothetical protein